MVDTLERYFDANKTKPSDGQMITWASELKVPFDDVHEWFYKKWKGNIKLTDNLLHEELFFPINIFNVLDGLGLLMKFNKIFFDGLF